MIEKTFARLLSIKKRMPYYFEDAASIIESYMNNGKLVGRTSYTFFSNGFLHEAKNFTHSGKLTFISQYSYSKYAGSDTGYHFTEDHFRRDSGKRYRVEYQFDSDKNAITEEEYQNDNLTGRGMYSLDHCNLCCLKHEDLTNNFIEQYSYDDSGNLIRTENTRYQGTTVDITEMSYNDMGDCINIRSFTGSGSVLTDDIKIAYKYDSRNNWVQKIETIIVYENGIMLGEALTEKNREICYKQESPFNQATV
jgi:YD repeat-containing protein